MKKIIILSLLIICVGCAHKQKMTYVVPDDIKQRAININYSVVNCIKPVDKTALFIANNEAANAYYDYKNSRIVLNKGLFQLDDDTIKYVLAHEVAHVNLGHAQKKMAASYAITGVMVAAGFFVPGAGLLNHVVNPAIVNNYSKVQETDADLMAYKACLCMGLTKDNVIGSMMEIQQIANTGGGFFDQHPSWDDRIKAVQEAP